MRAAIGVSHGDELRNFARQCVEPGRLQLGKLSDQSQNRADLVGRQSGCHARGDPHLVVIVGDVRERRRCGQDAFVGKAFGDLPREPGRPGEERKRVLRFALAPQADQFRPALVLLFEALGDFVAEPRQFSHGRVIID